MRVKKQVGNKIESGKSEIKIKAQKTQLSNKQKQKKGQMKSCLQINSTKNVKHVPSFERF
jgi:hypothetical protein